MERETCSMPTSSLRLCSRPARYRYVREHEGTSANPDVTVAAYCAQHDRARGHSRMLRPAAWEYDYVIDLASGTRRA